MANPRNSYQEYRGKDALTCYNQIRFFIRNYISGLGCNGPELMAATDAAAQMYISNPNLDEVPLAEDMDCPSQQDFVRLEHWFLKKIRLEIYTKAEKPEAGTPTAETSEQHDAEKPAGMVQDVHDIANKVDQLITSDKEAKARFTYHITKLCDMVEDYTEALQPYVEKIRRAEKRWKQNKIIGKTLADFCPPPRGWRGIGWRDNLYIKIDMSVIYRPVEPVNPLLWFGLFGNANIQRSPTEKEKLMCDYVLLALVHDWELQYSGTPIDRWIFSTDYKGKWFKCNEFCEDVWMYYHYPCSETFRLSATIQEKLSQLNRALEHVQADKKKDGQDENWHNDDFSEVIWNGIRYKFNKPQQALSVKYLWENKRGREKSIGEAIKSEAENFRLIHIFRQQGKKTKMHPAWGTMIVPDGKGIFALAECKKTPKK